VPIREILIFQRQLFYTNQGYVAYTNRTGTNQTWSTPETIRIQAISTGSPGLCAIVNVDIIETIRVYYGGSQNGIQELGYMFTDDQWGEYAFWTEGDVKSGIGCTTKIVDGSISAIIYFRDSTNGTLRKYSWDYGNTTGDPENYEWPAGMLCERDT